MKLPQQYQEKMREDAGLSDEERDAKRKRDRTPLPKGVYLLRCKLTEDIAGEGDKSDQVKFVWSIVEPEEDFDENDLTKREVWDWVSMSDNASWKMRQIFDAAGYEYHSDTDELSEDEVEVVAQIDQRKQTVGKNKGTIQHFVAEYFNPDDAPQIGLDDAA